MCVCVNKTKIMISGIGGEGAVVKSAWKVAMCVVCGKGVWVAATPLCAHSVDVAFRKDVLV